MFRYLDKLIQTTLKQNMDFIAKGLKNFSKELLHHHSHILFNLAAFIFSCNFVTLFLLGIFKYPMVPFLEYKISKAA